MIAAWQYKRYLDRQMIAEQTTQLLNIQIPKNKPRVHVQDLVGLWYDGRPMDKTEVIRHIKDKRRRKWKA